MVLWNFFFFWQPCIALEAFLKNTNLIFIMVDRNKESIKSLIMLITFFRLWLFYNTLKNCLIYTRVVLKDILWHLHLWNVLCTVFLYGERKTFIKMHLCGLCRHMGKRHRYRQNIVNNAVMKYKISTLDYTTHQPWKL